MCASWVKKYDPSLLVNHIRELRQIDAKGRVSFLGFDIEEVLSILFSVVDLGVDLPEMEKSALLRQAVFASAVRKDLQKEHLLAEISRRTANYQRRTEKKFHLATSLSLKYSPNFVSKRLDSASFRFRRYLPGKFDRNPFKDRIDMFKRDSREGQYTAVVATIRARSPTEAMSRGLDCLDLLRGIWNLYLNLRSGMRISTGEKQPVNQIRLGRIHTLHKPDGKLASGFFWHEPDFVVPAIVKSLTAEWKKLQKFERWVRNRLRQTTDADFISDAIRRYTRALDEKKLDNSFLKLWSLLEFLTGTISESYDRTIRRVVFRYKEPDWERQVLEHLRDHRNRAVHHMESTEQSETLVYQLKRYVEHLLVFHLKCLNTFSSLKECWQYLDMPRDRAEVQKRLALARRTLKLIDKRER